MMMIIERAAHATFVDEHNLEAPFRIRDVYICTADSYLVDNCFDYLVYSSWVTCGRATGRAWSAKGLDGSDDR